MTMHLLPPMYSTTGKKRGKFKFSSSEQKRQHEQLNSEWEQLKKQHQPARAVFSKSFTNSKMPKLVIPAGRGTAHIKSLNTGAAVAVKNDVLVYTGTKVKGIGTMHKSNAVPIFSDDEAIEIATMRRN
jgi:hypothetical protein